MKTTEFGFRFAEFHRTSAKCSFVVNSNQNIRNKTLAMFRQNSVFN